MIAMDASEIDSQLNTAKASVRVVIETPQGSRAKYAFDPETGLFRLSGLLPEGFAFPLDFGFIPQTLAEDGDPLDVLVLNDEPGVVGCLLTVRVVGAIVGDQTEAGTTVRNDRLVAVYEKSIRYSQVTQIKDLGARFVDNLEAFWISSNDAKGRTYTVQAVCDAAAAIDLIERAATAKRQG